jgi:hypothetical protein
MEGLMNGGYTDTRNSDGVIRAQKYVLIIIYYPFIHSFIHSFVTHSITPKQEHMQPLYIPSQTKFSLICLLLSVILLLSHTLQFIYIAPSCPCAHHEGTWGEQTSNSTHSSPRHSPAWVVSTAPCRFTSGIQTASGNETVRWVDPRVSLGVLEKTNFVPLPEIGPRSLSHPSSHYSSH